MDRESSSVTSAVQLACSLISVATAGASEGILADQLGSRLAASGMTVRSFPLAHGRSSIVASVGEPRLAFTAHLDTVPYQESEWSFAPTSGAVRNGRICGRGASDTKSAVAAMVVASEVHLQRRHRCGGFQLVLTAGEETGCEGARQIVARQGLAEGDLLVVGEPTTNDVYFGHKGVVWLKVATRGKAAHGSRPDLGHNAIIDLARIITSLPRTCPVLSSKIWAQ